MGLPVRVDPSDEALVPPKNVEIEQEQVHFDPKWFQQCIDRLQGTHVEDPEDLEHIPQEHLVSWLRTLKRHAAEGPQHLLKLSQSSSPKVGYKIESLILAVRMSGLLRADCQLKNSLRLSAQMLGYPAYWITESVNIPSQQTVSRYRFVLDAGWCLLWRQRFTRWILNGVDFAIFLLTDSSPHGGREYLFSEMFILFHLDRLDEATRELIAMRRRGDKNTERIAELTAIQKECMLHHTLVPTSLGARNQNLPQKFASVIFQFRMDNESWYMTNLVASKVRCVTTDYGTEIGLQSVPRFQGNELYPWWSDVDQFRDWFNSENVSDESVVLSDSSVGFENSLKFPGMEHQLHNLQQKATGTMKHFKTWFSDAKEIGNMLQCRAYITLIVNCCCTTPESNWLRERLLSSKIPAPYEKRFAALTLFLEALLPMEPLQGILDPDLFDDKSSKKAGEDVFIDMSKVVAAVKSTFFWRYASMLVCLAGGVHDLRMFCRSCLCHGVPLLEKYEADNIYTLYMRRKQHEEQTLSKEPCLLKGCVGPPLACGKGQRTLEDSLKNFEQRLIPTLHGLHDFEKAIIMEDFHLGCEQLMYHAKLRFSVLQVIPLGFMGLAEEDEVLAREQGCRCKAQWLATKDRRHHPATEELMQEDSPFWLDLRRFCDGESRSNCIAIKKENKWLSKVRCNEVSVERLHRIGTLESAHAANHGPVFLSHGLRGREMRMESLTAAEFETWAAECDKVRSIDGLVKEFGFQRHPALLKDRDAAILKGRKAKEIMCREKTCKEVFYRGDMDTLFDKYGLLQQAIAKAAEELKEDMAQAIIDPLAEAKDAFGDPSLATRGLAAKFALKHFQVSSWS